MHLTHEQKVLVQNWITEEGVGLPEVQNRLDQVLGLKLTYMEVRFLVDDLDLEIQGKKESVGSSKGLSETQKSPENHSSAQKDAFSLADWELVDPGGSVHIYVDSITRPGTVFSGKVTFSDGKKASWELDHYGQLGLVADETGYRPSALDVQSFQEALQKELQKTGF